MRVRSSYLHVPGRPWQRFEDGREGEGAFYMLALEGDQIIDARPAANLARFANHSCDPNMVMKKWNVLGLNDEGERNIPVSRTKYEWQAGPDSRTNWENIFQFRPSGIRVKRGNYFPALVAMAQIPVVGWLKRHITPKECARIQSFDVDGKHGKPFVLGSNDGRLIFESILG